MKVRFHLPPDADGWPPVANEGLWAEPLGNDLYRIDNTPWFALDLATDDIVVARPGDDGRLWAVEKQAWSGHMTFRVIPWKDGPLEGDRQAVLDAFAPLGVIGKGLAQFGMVALDVPPGADLGRVKMLLRSGQADGRWDFDEGCIPEEWKEVYTPLRAALDERLRPFGKGSAGRLATAVAGSSSVKLAVKVVVKQAATLA